MLYFVIIRHIYNLLYKTIGKYLGSKYKVMAPVGRIRNFLPVKSSSIDPDKDFVVTY